MIAIYVVTGIAIGIGLLTIYAPKIERWCDEQLAKQPSRKK